MTDYTDLIERLRGNDMPWSVKDAADALEAQARRIAELEALYDKLHVEWWEVLNTRIAELEAEVAGLNECLTLAHIDGFEKGRDAARAAYKDFANAG
jgi:hypothetical protein